MKPKQMIIVWKWTDLEDHDLTDHMLKRLSHRIEKYLQIDQVEGQLFKCYPVIEEEEEKVDACTIAPEKQLRERDRIIITSINRGKETEQIMLALLRELTSPEIITYLFLHRGHRYDASDVKYYLRGFNIDKCFLFHGKNDFIYYSTFGNGLLDNTGGFFVKPKKGISVLNPEKTAVRRPYFERVWTYYKDELERKLFELRHHLVQAYLPISRQTTIPSDRLIALLSDSRWHLNLRFKSFLGQYDDLDPYEDRDRSAREERGLLEAFERKKGQSYTFDDWKVNISSLDNYQEIKDELNDLCDQIKRLLFAANSIKDIHSNSIQQILDSLEKIILLVPGEITEYV